MLLEWVTENRLTEIVNISERQYGFHPGKSTILPLLCLRIEAARKTQRVRKVANEVCELGKCL